MSAKQAQADRALLGRTAHSGAGVMSYMTNISRLSPV